VSPPISEERTTTARHEEPEAVVVRRDRGEGERLGAGRPEPHISVMKNIELSDAEAETLTQKLAGIVDSARYPLSPRIQTLRAVLGRLRPEAARPAASPEPRVYEPPARGQYRRRG
jgi:hypothetical protein